MIKCRYCNKFYKSYKSWHRHKTLQHFSKIGEYNPRDNYKQSPKYCKSCKVELSYHKRHNTFCNRSCSAKYNNKQRDNDIISKIKRNTWHKNRPEFKSKRIKPLKFCKECKTILKNRRLTYCHPTCCKTKYAKIHYRNLCRFNLNPVDHYSLYNFDLMQAKGWYRPANHPSGYNPGGVTWDHLFRVEDGYKMGIDPKIISHPANAEMVTWRENIKRRKSTITLEQLTERISNWS